MSLFNLKQVASRLRAERKRLGYSKQADMAAALGVAERTYWDREAGLVAPDAELFAKFCELGGDVMYVITGQHSINSLMQERAPYTPAERLAEGIRNLTLSDEDAEILRGLAARLAK